MINTCDPYGFWNKGSVKRKWREFHVFAMLYIVYSSVVSVRLIILIRWCMSYAMFFLSMSFITVRIRPISDYSIIPVLFRDFLVVMCRFWILYCSDDVVRRKLCMNGATWNGVTVVGNTCITGDFEELQYISCKLEYGFKIRRRKCGDFWHCKVIQNERDYSRGTIRNSEVARLVFTKMEVEKVKDKADPDDISKSNYF